MGEGWSTWSSAHLLRTGRSGGQCQTLGPGRRTTQTTWAASLRLLHSPHTDERGIRQVWTWYGYIYERGRRFVAAMGGSNVHAFHAAPHVQRQWALAMPSGHQDPLHLQLCRPLVICHRAWMRMRKPWLSQVGVFVRSLAGVAVRPLQSTWGCGVSFICR